MITVETWKDAKGDPQEGYLCELEDGRWAIVKHLPNWNVRVVGTYESELDAGLAFELLKRADSDRKRA